MTGGATLLRQTRALISAHWSEIARALAPPTVAWKWSESDVPHKVKYRWKDAGLTRRAPGGERWMTTMALWSYVIECAGDDESVGVDAVGQQLLPVDVDAQSGTRVLSSMTPTPAVTETRQTTLNGDLVDDSADVILEEVRENRRKNPTRISDRERAAALAGQTRLQTIEDHDTELWETHHIITDGVAVAVGHVYSPADTDSTTNGIGSVESGVDPGQTRLRAFNQCSWSVTV